MTTSILFNVNRYIMLEYIYSNNDDISLSTNIHKFKKILNNYQKNEMIIVNDDNSFSTTKNIVKDSVVLLDDGRYVKLNNTTGYYYPYLDNNISIQDVPINPSASVVYDKIKIHILSGYSFNDSVGAIFSIYLRMNNNKQLRFLNTFIPKNDIERLIFNPKPIIISEFVYDKYIEILIPSQSEILKEQNQYIGSQNTLSYKLTDGILIANQFTYYVEHQNVKSSDIENGIEYFRTDNITRFSISSIDLFDELIAEINEIDGYFEYSAKWGDSSIEDYIYRLNSVAGNKYYIVHNLKIIEQIGENFIQTDNITSIQTDSYNIPKKFIPIIKNSSNATSFSVEYTIRLYNSNDGRSVFKSSYITCTNINRYNGKYNKLNVGNITQPLKVYNKINNSNINIIDNTNKVTQTKVTQTFVNNNDIQIKNDDNTTLTEIKITPFDDYFKFNIFNKDKSNNEIVQVLDSNSGYYIAFLKNDRSKYYIQETKSSNVSKSEGELLFEITNKSYEEIRTFTNKSFYIICRNINNTESIIYIGNWKI